MNSKLKRRSFMRTLAAGGALGVAHPHTLHSRSLRSRRTPKHTVRIGTIQSRHVPTCDGLKTNPFQEGFSEMDLFTSIERRVAWYEDLFKQASNEKCRLVVVTEDFTRLSLCMRYLDDCSIFEMVVDKQTPLIRERFEAAAKTNDVYIVASYFAREGGHIYNVADLFGPRGEIVGTYRKVHMPQYELWQVTPGDTFPAFETDIGWIGMLICYDQMWPEAASCTALNGAQLICQPSAAILEDFLMRTRAVDNQVHFVSSTSRRSMITSPRAEILVDAGDKDPAIVWADVDLKNATVADQYFWEYLYSGIQDHKERHLKFRRPETYSVIGDPNPPLARQYKRGGVANSAEAVSRVYGTLKEMERRRQSGENVPYHWQW